MKKTKIKKTKATCGICETYRNIPAQGRYNISKYRQERDCPVLEERVDKDTSVCKEFVLSRYVFCIPNYYWIQPGVCIKRYPNFNKCKRCAIGKYLMEERKGKL